MKIVHQKIDYEFVCDHCKKNVKGSERPEKWYGLELEEGLSFIYFGKEKAEVGKNRKGLHFCSQTCYLKYIQEVFQRYEMMFQ